ncbi:hypothetical protein E2P81_ATG02695 [Venturia nashicola]|uniref:Uncharacterized protein n=1 Tax=Venturia nashicola TaxID=86259 RepID=A0A4Z1PP41_9PEZI|nr:hypothetical protein E6O75_ATG02757 [Venturia nashicola]TLD36913.1 hypothetical protein E2P81_ATG02695 [Venturia nashicola]
MSGRGGAGNFWQAQEAAKKREADLEAAQRKPSIPSHQTSPSSSSPASSQKPIPANIHQNYAHMGRGGSGNWYEPKILAETGAFSAPEAPESTKPLQASKEGVSDTRRRGRGGAGNFVWDEDESRNGKDGEVKEIELKEMVVRDVEKGLTKPPRVVQRGGEREGVGRAFVRDWED